MKEIVVCALVISLATPVLAQTNTVQEPDEDSKESVRQDDQITFEELDKLMDKYATEDKPKLQITEYLSLGKSEKSFILSHTEEEEKARSGWGIVLRVIFQ